MTIGPFIAARGESLTLRTRVLGARNVDTHWPIISYTTTTILGMFKEMGQSVRDTPEGRITETRARLYTITPVQMKDQVLHNGVYWEIEDVQFRHPLMGNLGYYDSTMLKLITP